MFLLPSLLFGVVFALILGGNPARLANVRLRATWTVLAALVLQAVLFSRLGAGIPDDALGPLHVGTYGLLFLFALANLRIRALLPVLAGMTLNAVAIGANGGKMPISGDAAAAAGLGRLQGSNVDEGATHLAFLGDVFALPSQIPLANTFSVGDLLMGLGMTAFIIAVSLGPEATSLRPSRLLQPFGSRPYRRLAGGRLVSHLGDWITIAALVGWIYQETGSTAQVAGVMLVRLVPPIIGGSIAAVVVDHLPKRGLLIWVEVLRGCSIGLAVIGISTDERGLIFAALAVSGIFAAISNAAVPALVPQLIPERQLAAANAGLGMAKDGAMAIGAALAGVALSLTGVTVALLVDIVTFGVAVACFSALPAPKQIARDRAKAGLSGIRYLFRTRSLVILMLSFASATFATGLTNATLPRLLESEMGFGPGAYGFALAALAGGLALGGMVVGLARVGPDAGRWIGLGLLMMAGLFVLLGVAEHALTALLFIGMIGLVDGATDVLFETSVQREADPQHYGAVFGLASAFMTSTMVIAVAIAPFANELLDPRRVVITASAFVVIAGLIALVGLSRRRARGVTRIYRKGEDISLVVCGSLLERATAAIRTVESELSVEIVALPATGEFNAAVVLESVAKTSRVVILHENSGNEVRAGEVAALLADEGFEHLDAPVKRICVPGQDVAAALRDLAAV